MKKPRRFRRGSGLSPLTREAGAYNAISRLTDQLADALIDLIFGNKAHNLLRYLATLEEKQGRNAANTITHRSGRIPIHIHLHHLELAAVLHRDLVHDGRQCPARPAPGSPKIDQNRLLGLQHLLLKCRIVYFEDPWSCHVPPSLPG